MLVTLCAGVGVWTTNGVGGGLNSMSAFYVKFELKRCSRLFAATSVLIMHNQVVIFRKGCTIEILYIIEDVSVRLSECPRCALKSRKPAGPKFIYKW